MQIDSYKFTIKFGIQSYGTMTRDYNISANVFFCAFLRHLPAQETPVRKFGEIVLYDMNIFVYNGI